MFKPPCSFDRVFPQTPLVSINLNDKIRPYSSSLSPQPKQYSEMNIQDGSLTERKKQEPEYNLFQSQQNWVRMNTESVTKGCCPTAIKVKQKKHYETQYQKQQDVEKIRSISDNQIRNGKYVSPLKNQTSKYQEEKIRKPVPYNSENKFQNLSQLIQSKSSATGFNSCEVSGRRVNLSLNKSMTSRVMEPEQDESGTPKFLQSKMRNKTINYHCPIENDYSLPRRQLQTVNVETVYDGMFGYREKKIDNMSTLMHNKESLSKSVDIGMEKPKKKKKSVHFNPEQMEFILNHDINKVIVDKHTQDLLKSGCNGRTPKINNSAHVKTALVSPVKNQQCSKKDFKQAVHIQHYMSEFRNPLPGQTQLKKQQKRQQIADFIQDLPLQDVYNTPKSLSFINASPTKRLSTKKSENFMNTPTQNSTNASSLFLSQRYVKGGSFNSNYVKQGSQYSALKSTANSISQQEYNDVDSFKMTTSTYSKMDDGPKGKNQYLFDRYKNQTPLQTYIPQSPVKQQKPIFNSQNTKVERASKYFSTNLTKFSQPLNMGKSQKLVA